MFQTIGTARTRVAVAMAGAALLLGACSGNGSKEASSPGSNAARTEATSAPPDTGAGATPATPAETEESVAGDKEAGTGGSTSSPADGRLTAGTRPESPTGASAPKTGAAQASAAGAA